MTVHNPYNAPCRHTRVAFADPLHGLTFAAKDVKFRADIGGLEIQLAAAIEERTKLQREITNLKREAEATWAAERVENALLQTSASTTSPPRWRGSPPRSKAATRGSSRFSPRRRPPASTARAAKLAASLSFDPSFFADASSD